MPRKARRAPVAYTLTARAVALLSLVTLVALLSLSGSLHLGIRDMQLVTRAVKYARCVLKGRGFVELDGSDPNELIDFSPMTTTLPTRVAHLVPRQTDGQTPQNPPQAPLNPEILRLAEIGFAMNCQLAAGQYEPSVFGAHTNMVAEGWASYTVPYHNHLDDLTVSLLETRGIPMHTPRNRTRTTNEFQMTNRNGHLVRVGASEPLHPPRRFPQLCPSR